MKTKILKLVMLLFLTATYNYAQVPPPISCPFLIKNNTSCAITIRYEVMHWNGTNCYCPVGCGPNVLPINANSTVNLPVCCANARDLVFYVDRCNGVPVTVSSFVQFACPGGIYPTNATWSCTAAPPTCNACTCNGGTFSISSAGALIN